jgi:hypothetical protein
VVRSVKGVRPYIVGLLSTSSDCDYLQLGSNGARGRWSVVGGGLSGAAERCS